MTAKTHLWLSIWRVRLTYDGQDSTLNIHMTAKTHLWLSIWRPRLTYDYPYDSQDSLMTIHMTAKTHLWLSKWQPRLTYDYPNDGGVADDGGDDHEGEEEVPEVEVEGGQQVPGLCTRHHSEGNLNRGRQKLDCWFGFKYRQKKALEDTI